MALPAIQRLTEEEYLTIERAAERKSEFYAGEMFAMAGASPAHNLIVANVVGELHAQLKGGPCRVYPSDMRVKVSATGLYTYPDVLVVCGEPRYTGGEERDILLNPTLIVEVLSPSTEAYDRGVKFAHYRSVESLKEYVLVSQDRTCIESYTRRESTGEWLYAEVHDPAGSIRLPSIDGDLRLADVYRWIEFPEPGSDRLRSPMQETR